MEKKKGKVAVGMSGGVDSSVAAALLVQEGYEVIGVFMHFWTDPAQEKKGSDNRCCSLDSFMDARRVAHSLGIPLYTFNYVEKFKKNIVDYFVSQYKAGVTPNPCVMCNQSIKTGGFVEHALSLGCDFIATGHYARVKRAGDGASLLEGKDLAKDQSYFLYRLNQSQLQHLLLPVGEYTKPEVRELAKKFNLPTAKKRDSQEICFITTDSHQDFLARHVEHKPGDIIDQEGKVRGQHKGLVFYTLGQRKGLDLGYGGPYYVVGKDSVKNSLFVTSDAADPRLFTKTVSIPDVTWTQGVPTLDRVYDVKIRSMMRKVKGTLQKGVGGFTVTFVEPMKSVTPGQSLVLYEGDRVLGGGVIN